MDPTADALIRSFERYLRARNRARTTITNYLGDLTRAQAALETKGKSLSTATKADLEDHIGKLLARRAASTAATRYKSLRVFYKWLEEGGVVGGRERPAAHGRSARPRTGHDGRRWSGLPGSAAVELGREEAAPSAGSHWVRRSSRTSRFSAAILALSSVLVPGRCPPSVSACRTQARSDSVPMPNCRAMGLTNPNRSPVCSIVSSTIRTARSRSSGG
jgi:hypothetical protein